MTKIDWLIIRRIFARILVVVAVIFSLIALVESLDAWRFKRLSELGGPQLAILGIVTNATRWTIKTLPVTVLIGGILGVLDLQARREMTVIKASGMSIWRVMRAPLLAVIVASLAVSVIGETINTQVNRTLNPTPPVGNGGLTDGELWLEQHGEGQNYILRARDVARRGTQLFDVTVFFTEPGTQRRIMAERARLKANMWEMTNAVELRIDQDPLVFPTLNLETASTAADLRLKLGSTEDYTIFELAEALNDTLTDPDTRAAAATRLLRLLSLPILLTGSLLIAFAFTSGYRRTNKYGPSILYGIVLGFVVFVITEMGDRAGSAGVLAPTVAAIGPAFVAIVIGLTVLLYKEDGRT